MTEKLPKFDNPPVVETVLGVAFKPLVKWHVPHFGLYWNRIRGHYPKQAVQPPLPIEQEIFGQHSREVTIKVGRPEDRCWFFDNEEKWLLQVQESRFISNWRRHGVKYLNFKTFLERFTKEWDRFSEFVDHEELGKLELTQTEVSYVNHIEMPSGFDGLGKIFPIWGKFRKDRKILGLPEAVSFNSVYVIDDNRGRLYLALLPVIRHSDGKKVVQLTITAKTLIASNNRQEIIDALKLAHKWVVCGFADFTSDEAHQLWGRTQ